MWTRFNGFDLRQNVDGCSLYVICINVEWMVEENAWFYARFKPRENWKMTKWIVTNDQMNSENDQMNSVFMPIVSFDI